ncbi:MAG: 5-deoxy-glucuronate isomerase [Candidatus Omnitrophica bacterium]|nr:5-deoxy-glucuronate isomerase [Candidatus Omnitrophota bacterium]
MDLQKRCLLQTGVNRVLTSGSMGLSFLELDIIVLNPAEKHQEKLENKEGILTVLSGRGRVEIVGLPAETLGSRQDVFRGKPEGAYLGSGTFFSVTAETTLEAALFRSPVAQVLPSYFIKEEKIRPEKRGGLNFSRFVSDVVGIKSPAARLIVGETIGETGNWSSYPPHKHDRDRMPEESLLEEVYFFRFRPENGFGLMRIYTEDESLDQPILIRHNDLVSIPRGYHPVVAAAGYEVYYLWALAGPKREMRVYEDPAHRWVNKK